MCLLPGHNVVLSEEDIIIRYDGPPEIDTDCGGSQYDPDEVDTFVEEEMRLAETMSMAVFLSLNTNKAEEENKPPRRRNSNLKEVNQLETVDEASQGEISNLIPRVKSGNVVKLSECGQSCKFGAV